MPAATRRSRARSSAVPSSIARPDAAAPRRAAARRRSSPCRSRRSCRRASCSSAYAAAEAADGTRILVDRPWPRGVSRQKAALDDWMKDIAPSTGLRQWFGHAPSRWVEFQRRYKAELRQHGADLDRLRGSRRRAR
ncbi:MAG: DUF488 family protein [Lysobacterales bacterium]